MKIRRGFVSNSSTYSYITYIKKDRLEEEVYYTSGEISRELSYNNTEDPDPSKQVAFKIRDFGEVFETDEQFKDFMGEYFDQDFPEFIFSPKSPDEFVELGSEGDDQFNAINEFLSYLKEFQSMKNQGYVAIHVLKSSETDEFAHLIAYCCGVRFEGTGGFTVTG